MKIYGIYLIEQVLTGGNRRYIELLEGLAKNNHDVIVFVHPKVKPEFNYCRTEVMDIKLKKYKRISVQNANRLKSFLKEHKLPPADFILVFGETDWAAAKVLNAFCKAKIIFAYRSDIIEENKAFLKYETISLKDRIFLKAKTVLTALREKQIGTQAYRLVFQTEYDKNNFLARNKKNNVINKCVVIPNDIYRPRYKKIYENKNKSVKCNKLLFVGSYDIRKGLLFLLKALAILKRKNLNFTCTIAARGAPPKRILNFILNNDITDCVTFKSDMEDVQPLMVEHDLLIVPSLFDSFPNVIMEAFHTGLPAIAADTSGMPYMLHHCDLLFKPADAESIAAKILTCIQDEVYYNRLREQMIHRKPFFQFDWIRKWEDLF